MARRMTRQRQAGLRHENRLDGSKRGRQGSDRSRATAQPFSQARPANDKPNPKNATTRSKPSSPAASTRNAFPAARPISPNPSRRRSARHGRRGSFPSRGSDPRPYETRPPSDQRPAAEVVSIHTPKGAPRQWWASRIPDQVSIRIPRMTVVSPRRNRAIATPPRNRRCGSAGRQRRRRRFQAHSGDGTPIGLGHTRLAPRPDQGQPLASLAPPNRSPAGQAAARAGSGAKRPALSPCPKYPRSAGHPHPQRPMAPARANGARPARPQAARGRKALWLPSAGHAPAEGRRGT